MIESLRQDLRYAIRTFLRAPGFTLLAILTTAIGVGASTAIFSIVNTVLLKPLPFADPDALVLVAQSNRQTRQSFGNLSPANFLDWRTRNHSFTAMAAFTGGSATLSSNERPELVPSETVSASFFDFSVWPRRRLRGCSSASHRRFNSLGSTCTAISSRVRAAEAARGTSGSARRWSCRKSRFRWCCWSAPV